MEYIIVGILVVFVIWAWKVLSYAFNPVEQRLDNVSRREM